jgi:hypothetical protein
VGLRASRQCTNGGMLPSAEGTVPKLDSEQRKIITGVVPEVGACVQDTSAARVCTRVCVRACCFRRGV